MIKEDICAYGISKIGMIKGFFTGHTIYSVIIYRIGNFLVRHHIKFLPNVLKGVNQLFFSCDFSPYATIGKYFRIQHSVGVVVGHSVEIGNNCELFQNVTIGSNRRVKNGKEMPSLGNNVTVYTGAVIVGPIHIGDNSIIGAGCYVDFDVPANSIIKRVPSQIIRSKKNGGL